MTSDDNKKTGGLEEEFFVESKWRYREEHRRLDAGAIVKLEPKHVKVIRETWPLVSTNLTANGVKMYMKIFEINPKIQAVFKLDKYQASQLSTNKRLKLHASRFMQSIECAVKHLDELDSAVKPIFINLGKHHIHFEGIKSDFFNIFSGALMYVWRDSLGARFTPEARGAWSRLFDFILQHLNFGFQLELQDRAKAEAAKEDTDY